MDNQAQELIPVTAALVDDEHRLDFLPTYFGPRLMMRGEALVYGWMRRLAESYNGGFWNYYTLTNGGFYMPRCWAGCAWKSMATATAAKCPLTRPGSSPRCSRWASLRPKPRARTNAMP